ncbi:MAG TPA: hypothetical protein VFF52_24590 [Isosphaeraceae bacterium]|nr:hypothetical protein [Isosphaeraceae bacterium]
MKIDDPSQGELWVFAMSQPVATETAESAETKTESRIDWIIRPPVGLGFLSAVSAVKIDDPSQGELWVFAMSQPVATELLERLRQGVSLSRRDSLEHVQVMIDQGLLD